MFKIILALSCFSFLLSSAHADIFGSDDRHNIAAAGPKRYLGKSVAIGVINSLWEGNQVDVAELWADPISDYMCKDERFINQKSVSYACTGFLVGKDLLVTAGHCGVNFGETRHQSKDYCEAYTWLFDYTASSDTKAIPKENIFKCKEIIYAVQEEVDGNAHDFALIRLDREVVGRTPLKMANKKSVTGDSVFMIGHPMGLPMKYTDNAHIFEPEIGRSYYTNLDAFGGNSGSPVFNNKDEVIGVLVAGNPSSATYTDHTSGCDRYNRCDEQGKNCKDLNLPNGAQGFPNVYSEVQSIEFYKKLIEENL